MAKDGKRNRRSREPTGAPLAVAPEAVAPPMPAWQRAIGRLTGARACYGKPVEAHGHVVIPVATLRTLGGLGFGHTAPAPGDAPTDGSNGGGGGQFVDARPVGFIDIGPDGVRYQAIDVARPVRRASTTALTALGIIVATRLLGSAVKRRPAGSGPWPVRSLRR